VIAGALELSVHVSSELLGYGTYGMMVMIVVVVVGDMVAG